MATAGPGSRAPSAYVALLSTNANAGSNWGGPPLLGIILTHK
jgi:hypothetical protein